MTYQPFHIEGEDRPARWLITCDHAANTVPPAINGGSLGLDPADMARHIAFDPGTAGVGKALGKLLNAPVIMSNFSRLVIDPNRGEDDPTLLMKLYDGTIIPANRHADLAERERRLDLCYRPYHDALTRLGRAARHGDPVLAQLYPAIARAAATPLGNRRAICRPTRGLRIPFLDRLRQEADLTVGDNEPYSGHLPGDAVDRHALQHGRPNVLIELRNDLVSDADGQNHWAKRLAPMLTEVLDATRSLKEIQMPHFILEHSPDIPGDQISDTLDALFAAASDHPEFPDPAAIKMRALPCAQQRMAGKGSQLCPSDDQTADRARHPNQSGLGAGHANGLGRAIAAGWPAHR